MRPSASFASSAKTPPRGEPPLRDALVHNRRPLAPDLEPYEPAPRLGSEPLEDEPAAARPYLELEPFALDERPDVNGGTLRDTGSVLIGARLARPGIDHEGPPG